MIQHPSSSDHKTMHLDNADLETIIDIRHRFRKETSSFIFRIRIETHPRLDRHESSECENGSKCKFELKIEGFHIPLSGRDQVQRCAQRRRQITHEARTAFTVSFIDEWGRNERKTTASVYYVCVVGMANLWFAKLIGFV